MKKTKGYLCLVLHAHLPFVRHPEYPEFLEEDWLFEAITETYMPILKVLEKLEEDRVAYGITISLSPPLVALLSDWLLQDRYVKRLEKLIELASREVERTRWDSRINKLALMYHWLLENTRKTYVEKYSRDLVSVFRRLGDAGHVEITTCGATHGFLPLMALNRNAVRAQIEIACQYHQRSLGKRPKGIWLPECGYQPGIDDLLKESGLKFFFTDTHGILHATPRPRYGVFAPVYCPSGVAAFGRDMDSSKQVWSAQEGYPGDFHYRDFYRDVGFDLDYDYVKPYLHGGGGARVYTGIKYYRITGRAGQKELYDPDIAREKAAEHAGNFMFNREQQIKYLHDFFGKKPIIVAPYDAELFGHWWFEGPQWMDFLLRKCAYDQDVFTTITPSEYLGLHPKNQVATPSLSSWGWKGYNEVWLEGSNDWIYRHLHWASDRMVELANDGDGGDPVRLRALKQAARELLLAQSSDWAFIMKTGTAVQYAAKRTKDHLGRFAKLYSDIKRGTVDTDWLSSIEARDNIFPELDYRIYADHYSPAAAGARR